MPPKRKQVSSTSKGPAQTTLSGMKGDLRLSGKAAKSKEDSPTFTVSFEGKDIICQRFPSTSTSSSALAALVFTHGAGGGISNPATSLFAKGFSSSDDSSVVCFQGTMNLQSRVKSFHTVIEHEKAEQAALGGRSMGARAAVLAAKGHETKKLVLVSYPLVGQNGDVRDQILLDIDMGIEVLFVSGDGDGMCDLKQLAKVREKMKAKSWLIVVRGADHGMSVKPKEAVEKTREFTGEAAARWVKEEGREEGKTECVLRWDAHGRKVVDEGWTAAGAPTKSASKAKRGEAVEEDEKLPSAKRRKKG
jgi:predicted alpha/beta-hydrolase family hydrolase